MMKWIGLVLLVCILLIGGGVWELSSLHSVSQTVADPGMRIDVEVGKMLPDLTLTALNGEQIALSRMGQGHEKRVESRILMLTFWASWCETCLEEMPSIAALYQRYQKQGFAIAAVNLDEDPEQSVARIQKQFTIPFPIFKDPDGQLADIFDIQAIPLTLVLNRTREILMVVNGGRDWNSNPFQNQLQGWLAK